MLSICFTNALKISALRDINLRGLCVELKIDGWLLWWGEPGAFREGADGSGARGGAPGEMDSSGVACSWSFRSVPLKHLPVQHAWQLGSASLLLAAPLQVLGWLPRSRAGGVFGAAVVCRGTELGAALTGQSLVKPSVLLGISPLAPNQAGFSPGLPLLQLPCHDLFGSWLGRVTVVRGRSGRGGQEEERVFRGRT